jgi:hypothetical protein
MNFREYLKSRGFKPYRAFFKANDFHYAPCENEDYFSSIANGMIDVRYIKGDIEIIYGLFDYGYPPTVISPKRNAIDRAKWDRLIWSKTNEELYEYLTL